MSYALCHARLRTLSCEWSNVGQAVRRRGSLLDAEGLNQHKKYREKEQAADDSTHSPSKQSRTVTSKISPAEKQQSVPGRDTGES